MLVQSIQPAMRISDQARQYLQTTPLRTRSIIQEAQRIELFFSQIMQAGGFSHDSWEECQNYPKLKQLNSLGKQLVIRMLRSNSRFRGYKVDFDHHMLNPSVLFLAGTLCNEFDYAHTSPLFGLEVLDIGCGALSEYAPPDKDANLLSQFYGDRPPVGAELLQMLGAKTVGIDPRSHCSESYSYQITYRHRMVEFDDVSEWLQEYGSTFDVISCLNVLKRQSFLYGHPDPEHITTFLAGLRHWIVPNGLLYSTSPLPPSSEENCQTNRQIFHRAGFRILHEGYYLIAERL